MTRTLSRAVPTAFSVLLLAALLWPPALMGQAVELRWEFHEGQDLLYEMVQISRTSMGGMGEVVQTQTMRLRQEVLDVEADGAARLRTTYEGIAVSADGPMGRMSYDSDTDEAPQDPSLAPLAAMAGRSIEVTLAPDGTVRDLEGMAELMAEAVAGMPPEMQAVFQESFGEENLTEMMQQAFQTFPTEPVEPGEGWETTTTTSVGFGTMTSTLRHTLREVTERDGVPVAVVEVEGTLGAFEADPENPMAGMIESRGGAVEGSFLLDLENGRVVESTMESVMGMSAAGQEMTVTSEVVMRLVH